MQSAYLVAPDFFEEATALRQGVEQHFKNPELHNATHQIWNYWYVPGSYTYLRTQPDNLLPPETMARFMSRLKDWASETLGLDEVSYPWTSLYVDGCSQIIHNDSAAGQMGYVFSLTKWDERNFLGGETLLYKEENYWETNRIKSAGASTAFYDMIPSYFNQLLVFDDRVIHGVQRLEGTMAPLQGRIVLHGHMRANGFIVKGALNQDDLAMILDALQDALNALSDEYSELLHGFITLKVTVSSSGEVTVLQTVYDRLLPITSDKESLRRFREAAGALLLKTRYPQSAGDTHITVPLIVK